MALTRLIAATIEWELPYKHDGMAPVPHSSHESFVELLRELVKSSHSPSSVAVITLNYDCAVELPLWQHNIPYTYCLPYEKMRETVNVLKLHGSLNWHACTTPEHPLGEARALFVQDYVSRTRSLRVLAFSEEVFPLSKEASLLQGAMPGGPVIVPPSWTKTAVSDELVPIWREAALQLRDAARVYVIGYSLPPTDRFFRDLLSLGMQGGAVLERFWVFNPDCRTHRSEKGEDPADSAEARFDKIPGATVRENAYQFRPLPFSAAINELKGELES